MRYSCAGMMNFHEIWRRRGPQGTGCRNTRPHAVPAAVRCGGARLAPAGRFVQIDEAEGSRRGLHEHAPEADRGICARAAPADATPRTERAAGYAAGAFGYELLTGSWLRTGQPAEPELWALGDFVASPGADRRARSGPEAADTRWK